MTPGLQTPPRNELVIDMEVATQTRKYSQDEPLAYADTMQGGIAVQSFESVTMAQQPVGYDPNRIPSSVFSARPSSPLEWSVASNESLFSINVGSCSLSTDNFMMLYKSGELAKLDDSVKLSKPDDHEPTTVSKPDDSTHFQPRLAPVIEGESMYKTSEEDSKTRSITANVSTDAPKAVRVGTGEIHNPRKVTPSRDISARSTESLQCTKSFEFPVLKGDVERSRFMNNVGMVKEAPDKPQAQPQDTATTPKSSKSWFCCFLSFSPSSTKT